MTEHVLCVPTLLFRQVGYFEGFMANTEPYLKTLLDEAYLSYRPRDEVEDDPSYKQLIPYCVFRHGGTPGDLSSGEIFSYTRGGSGGESRLHAKRSVGIGGHISSEDGQAGTVAYDVGMRREIDEEVDLATGYNESLVGLINDDSNEVGQVHLGLVHIFDVEEAKVSPREESIQETGFAPPSQLASEIETFETWSQIVLRHLTGS